MTDGQSLKDDAMISTSTYAFASLPAPPPLIVVRASPALAVPRAPRKPRGSFFGSIVSYRHTYVKEVVASMTWASHSLYAAAA